MAPCLSPPNAASIEAIVPLAMEERRGEKDGWEADEGWDAEEAMAA